MNSFQVGDMVRYSVDFCRSTAIFTYDEEIGNTAEVISLNERIARLKWQDGSETSALLSNLAPASPHVPDSMYDPIYNAEMERKRALLLLDAAISVRQAWTT